MKSLISSKGQITLPVRIRRALGLGPGTAVDFELRPGGVFLRKRVPEPHPVDLAYGSLAAPGRVDDLLRELRGPKLRELRRRGAHSR